MKNKILWACFAVICVFFFLWLFSLMGALVIYVFKAVI
jgi:hypothetical protein